MQSSDRTKELHQICNFVLTRLGDLKPQLSTEITNMTKRGKYSHIRPLQKKLEKIRILVRQDPSFFEAVIAELNKAEYKGPVSAVNYFVLMERMLPSLHYKGETTGGNYRKV